MTDLADLTARLIADLDDAADARCVYREHGFNITRDECDHPDCKAFTELLAEARAALTCCPVCGRYAFRHDDTWSQTEGCPLMAAQVPQAVRAARPKTERHEQVMKQSDLEGRRA